MRIIVCVVILCASLLPAAVGGEFDPGQVRSAINRAIPWLERDMVAWRETNECAACHHGPMYLWSGHVAKRQGYIVSASQLQSYAKWIIDDESSRIFLAPETLAITDSSSAADRMTASMMGHRKLSQPTLYLSHALNAMPTDDPLVARGWNKLADHWRLAQMDDGSFAGRVGRPPIFNSPQILTLYASIALEDRANTSSEDQEQLLSLEQIRKQANSFLAKLPPDGTHHELVLDYSCLVRHEVRIHGRRSKRCWHCNARTEVGLNPRIDPATPSPRGNHYMPWRGLASPQLKTRLKLVYNSLWSHKRPTEPGR